MAAIRRVFTPAQVGFAAATLTTTANANNSNFLDCEGAICIVFRCVGVSATGSFTGPSCLPLVKVQQGRADKTPVNAPLASGASYSIAQQAFNTDQTNGRGIYVVIYPAGAGSARLPFAQVAIQLAVATANITNADCECVMFFPEGG